MRLRRFEFVIISVTLAFACFMGGYFVGRSGGTVSISPTTVSQNSTLTTTPQTQVQSPQGLAIPTSAPISVPVPEIIITNGANTQVPEEQPPEIIQETPPTPQLSSRDAQGRININTASRTELMDLPGIGSSLSERIVAYRTANGPFQNIEQLRNVS